MNKKQGFINITSMMVTGAIVATIMVVSWKMYEKAKSNAGIQMQAQVLISIQSLMNDIFQEQNPNDWPPDDVVPDGLPTWVMPTSLQTAETLREIIERYCRTFAGNASFNGRGRYSCEYHRTAGTGGTGGNTIDDPNGGGGGADDAGGTTGTTVPTTYTYHFASDIDEYCITPAKVAYKVRQQQAGGGGGGGGHAQPMDGQATDCSQDSSYDTLYNTAGMSASNLNATSVMECNANDGCFPA